MSNCPFLFISHRISAFSVVSLIVKCHFSEREWLLINVICFCSCFSTENNIAMTIGWVIFVTIKLFLLNNNNNNDNSITKVFFANSEISLLVKLKFKQCMEYFIICEQPLNFTYFNVSSEPFSHIYSDSNTGRGRILIVRWTPAV